MLKQVYIWLICNIIKDADVSGTYSSFYVTSLLKRITLRFIFQGIWGSFNKINEDVKCDTPYLV